MRRAANQLWRVQCLKRSLSFQPNNQWRLRRLSTTSSGNPLEQIQSAIDSLDDFSRRLRQLAEDVDRPHVVTDVVSGNTRSLTLPEIVLHSRDSTSTEFSAPMAVAARRQFAETARHVDAELRVFTSEYTERLAPQMEAATKMCQETPCWGASWEILNDIISSENDTDDTNTTDTAKTTPGGDGDGDGSSQTQGLDRLRETPCGRLQLASLQFLETTRDTKPQMTMASRSLLILELAQELEAPLRDVNASGTAQQKELIRNKYQEQVVSTPWIRTDDEYKQLSEIRGELEQ